VQALHGSDFTAVCRQRFGVNGPSLQAPVKLGVSPDSSLPEPPDMANTQQMANAIRALAMDAVQQANSGHPGAPMGMADMAVALWGQHLKHNPRNPA